jgi:hypothetical protein
MTGPLLAPPEAMPAALACAADLARDMIGPIPAA